MNIHSPLPTSTPQDDLLQLPQNNDDLITAKMTNLIGSRFVLEGMEKRLVYIPVLRSNSRGLRSSEDKIA